MDGQIPAPPPSQPGMSPQGQPPTGASPATMPVPNKGHEAAGMAQLSVIITLMGKTIPLLGATDPGRTLTECYSKLLKHVPAGSVSSGVQQSTMQNLLTQQRQMAPQIAALRAGGPPGGAPGGQPPAAA